MTIPVIDEEARNMARAAQSAMNIHEAVCAERWGTAISVMKDVKRIVAWLIVTVITGMGTMIWYFATHPPAH